STNLKDRLPIQLFRVRGRVLVDFESLTSNYSIFDLEFLNRDCLKLIMSAITIGRTSRYNPNPKSSKCRSSSFRLAERRSIFVKYFLGAGTWFSPAVPFREELLGTALPHIAPRSLW